MELFIDEMRRLHVLVGHHRIRDRTMERHASRRTRGVRLREILSPVESVLCVIDYSRGRQHGVWTGSCATVRSFVDRSMVATNRVVQGGLTCEALKTNKIEVLGEEN